MQIFITLNKQQIKEIASWVKESVDSDITQTTEIYLIEAFKPEFKI
ncbi:MAG: hypothetical protein ACFFA8_02600 [Promethearchaeota archaeon]